MASEHKCCFWLDEYKIPGVQEVVSHTLLQENDYLQHHFPQESSVASCNIYTTLKRPLSNWFAHLGSKESKGGPSKSDPLRPLPWSTEDPPESQFSELVNNLYLMVF